VKPAPFAYHLAHDEAETVALLADLGEDAKILAGGQSLVPMMNFRLARPTDLVDITRIPGLSYLRRDEHGLHVGALTRHRAIETASDQALLDGFGVLPSAARWIGHYPIRTRGTFGGSIAHADPASEWCLLAVALAAEVVLHGPAGRRTVPAGEFFQGFYSTVARPDEMIVEVVFPRPAPYAALTEFAYRQGDFAIVAAAVAAEMADGACSSVRVVLGGVAGLPFTVDTSELAGQPATTATWRAAGELAAAQVEPPSDELASATYRRRLTSTLVARALEEAVGPEHGCGACAGSASPDAGPDASRPQ
jgi:aerobic carbon-monoxide dehydrogenase medium subunit